MVDEPSPVSDRFTHVLVTGGAGFIGSHVVRALLGSQEPALRGARVSTLDALTYAGSQDTLDQQLADISDADGRHRLIHGDVRDPTAIRDAMRPSGAPAVDAVLHLAAESHVDRAIADASAFTTTNVLGTQHIAEAALEAGVPLVLVSTDEVFGDLPLDSDTRFDEGSLYAPRNPYAASKAAGDLLAMSLHHTHGLDLRLTHGGNTLGPFQDPEKLVPRFLIRLMRGRTVPLYGDGANVRDWLSAEEHAEGIVAALLHGRAGRRYCLSAGRPSSNLAMTHAMVAAVRELGYDADESRIQRVADRKGHDRRYAMDASRARSELGWSPRSASLDDLIADVAAWYARNEAWWSPRFSDDA